MNEVFYQSPFDKEYLFTVSNLTHELVNAQQYSNLISSSSQYQVIPGFVSNMIDDPWEVVLKTLPYTNTTLTDITLPFINFDPILEKQTKILARYILYKQQVIGIKTCTTNIQKSQSLLQTKFQWKDIQLPQKIINFYEQNQIKNYQKNIKVGDFFLVTSKFKIALFFQSQLKNQYCLLPYIKRGCQIISIVNDEEFNYNYFANNFSDPLIRRTIQEGIDSKIIRVRQVCAKYKLFLMYSGCRICPSLSQINYSKSFIENFASEIPSVETEDFEFIPVISKNDVDSNILQLNYNPNLTNISNVLELNQKRLERHKIINQDYLFKNYFSSIQKEIQLVQPLFMDSSRFQISPLSDNNRQKIQKYMSICQQKDCERQISLFSQVSISGKSMIRCMYLFNMINLFILSKQREKQSPFTIGVPFTNKTKNLFDTIVYVYDKIKTFQNKFIGLKKPFELGNFVQLYRYKDINTQNHDFSIEQELIRKITRNQMATIPTIQDLLKSKNKQNLIYLCSDDQKQKTTFKLICKQKGIQLNCLDLILFDSFNLPLDIKTQHLVYQGLLQLEQHRNVLEMYPLKLRQISFQKDNKQQKNMKPIFLPQNFIKLKRQLLKKRLDNIKDVLKFIILEKEFLYQQKNYYLFDEIINTLSEKYKNNIKSLSQISKFFITNSKTQIKQKVTVICQELMKKYKNKEIQKFYSNKEIIQLSSCDQNSQNCDQNNSTNEQNKVSEFNEQKKQSQQKPITKQTQEQIYNRRLEKAKKLKIMKQKKELLECHRCDLQMYKKQLLKCKSCYQLICYGCAQQLSGSNGLKITKQLQRFCPVCHKTCQCLKCKRKNNKTLQISQQLRSQLFQDDKNKDKQNKEKILDINLDLFKTFSNQSQVKKQKIKICKKCQLQNFGLNRSIWLECLSCAVHKCYFCVEKKYKQENYKNSPFDTFYKNWQCFDCDNQWKRYLKNKMYPQQEPQNIKKSQKNQKMQIEQKVEKSSAEQFKDNDSINQKTVNNIINNSKTQINYFISPIYVPHQENNQNVSQKDKSNINQSTFMKNNIHNEFKYESVNSSTNLTTPLINKYTLNDGKAVYLPVIHPQTKNPLFPLPQKENENPINDETSMKQQNRIPILPQPLPPKPLIQISVRQNPNIINEKQLKEKKNERRDSSESNNDSKKVNVLKEDKKKKRSKYQTKQKGPRWGKANKHISKGQSSSSSSSSTSSSSDSQSISSKGSTPNFGQRTKKDQKRRKQRKRNNKNRKRRTRSSSSSSSSSNSSSSSSSSSSQQKQKKRNQKKGLDLKITINPRVEGRNSKDRERSRSRQNDSDTNTRRYYPKRRSDSKDSKNDQSTRRTTKKNIQEDTNTRRPHEQNRRSQSSSKRQSVSSKRQQDKLKMKRNTLFDIKQISFSKEQSSDNREQNKFNRSQPQNVKQTIQQKQQQSSSKKLQIQQNINNKQEQTSKNALQITDPRKKLIDSKNEPKTTENNTFSQSKVTLQSKQSTPLQSKVQNQVKNQSIPLSGQQIYKTINGSIPTNKNRPSVVQNKQYNRFSNYNPSYKPPIRNLLTLPNTNNSFYTSYKIETQQPKPQKKEKTQLINQDNQSNKNLLFVKEKIKKNPIEEEEDIQY